VDPVTGFSLTSFALVSAASLVAVAVLMAVTAVVARRAGRVSVVDVTWGVGFAVVSVVGLLLGPGALGRRALLFGIVTIWGSRLALHVHRRNAGKGEDPRYEKMLAEAPADPFAYAVRRVFVVQGLSVWFVSLPIQVAAVTTGGLGVVAWVGVALWLVGVVFESVGDAQLAAFKADSANRGKVMDRGLWSLTRHPNYFGDSCVWWGIFLVAADVWPGVLTVLSPVVMTYFLVFATGARLLEREMAKRPGYPAYQQRTSYFLPLPPRRR